MERCRLSSSHIHVGVPLPGPVYDEPGNLLLKKGYVISQQAQVDTLLSRGMYVDIEQFNSVFRASAGSAAAASARKFDPFAVRSTLKLRLNRALRGLLAESHAAAELNELAADLVTYADTDPDAAVAGGLLDQDEAAYSIAHCLDTAIFAGLAARHLDWSAADRQSIVGAALSMNLAMIDAQLRLHRQTGPLSPAQREVIDLHPTQAAELLSKAGLTDPRWLAAVAQHHERTGGSGYPQHLVDPSEASQLLRLADVFGARLRVRADRKAAPGPQVIRTLFAEEAKGPQAGFANALVKAVGIVPPGSFVVLANHEVGVVFRRGGQISAPSVAVVTHSSGSPMMQPVRRETHRKEFAITSLLTVDKVNVGYDLGRLWVTDLKH